MKARLRQDLLDKNLLPPTSKGVLPIEYMDDDFECYQPDALDDAEFNLFIWTRDGHMFMVNSIDFDFVKG